MSLQIDTTFVSFTYQNETGYWSGGHLKDQFNLTQYYAVDPSILTLESPEQQFYNLRYGLAATILICFGYGLIFIIGSLGNMAVFLVICKSPRMRTPTNQFIANLAVADLMVNILCLPFTMIAHLVPAWSLGAIVCKAVSYLQGVSVSASVYTLVAISIERCIAISCPLTASMSSRQYKSTITVIWLAALSINLPWLYVFTIEPMGNGSNYEICIELWPSEQTENLFFILANLILGYLGPLTVISICYVIIWCKVDQRNVPGDNFQRKHFRRVINRSRLKVTKMVFVVIVTFAISWSPLYILFSVVKFDRNLYANEQAQYIIYMLLPLAQWLGASNSCINPLLYAYMNGKFRKSLKNVLWKNCCQFSSSAGEFDRFQRRNRRLYYKKQRFVTQLTTSTELPMLSTRL